MTEKRKQEIREESIRRMNIWIKESSFDEMTVYGSFIRFNMGLGLLGGYPFEKEKWMGKDDFGAFVTEEEYDSEEYDEIVGNLFKENLWRLPKQTKL